MPHKPVLVEMRDGKPYRIFKRRPTASEYARLSIQEMSYQDAVYGIRKQVFDRAGGNCERCSAPIDWNSGHMHESKPKGRGGEVSTTNCTAICPKCHLGPTGVHADHYPAWSKKGKRNGRES